MRVNVAAKSYLAKEIELIYRTHRADQHHAQRIAAGRLNGLVAFIATTGQAPRIDSTNDRVVTLAKWASECSKNPARTYAAQAQARTEQSVTVDVVKFGYEHLRVPSRSSKDARERMLASWRAEVLADPDHRDHGVLAGLAKRITNRRHEVALVAMLEQEAATGKVVNNRTDAALYGALRRARTARTDRSLSVLGQRLQADLEGIPRPVRTRALVVV